jgi:hypothetical protein
MSKKLKLSYLVICLLFATVFTPAPQRAEAGAPLVLGIVGTALGGTALALGLYNTYQNRKLRREIYYGDDYYYDDYNYNYGYQPAAYSGYGYTSSYNYYDDECYGRRCYYDDGYDYY